MTPFEWLKSVFKPPSGQAQSSVQTKSFGPDDANMRIALDRLEELARPAVFGEIGGVRPEKHNRKKSWWGGNFLGAEGETIPICERSGNAMHPILQIRVDELPQVPAAFDSIALINIWMDLEASPHWAANNGNGFVVRTYTDLDSLMPVGFGYRENLKLPTFPVLWRETALEQPSWEDMADEVPKSVAQSTDSDWFFESDYANTIYELRSKYPIKLGGWPAWIQGSVWPDDAEYFFQVDSTDKGKLYLGDSGSFYVFKHPGGWAIRSDCY